MILHTHSNWKSQRPVPLTLIRDHFNSLFYTFKWWNYDVSVERGNTTINKQSVSNDTLQSTPNQQWETKSYHFEATTLLLIWRRDNENNSNNNGKTAWPKLLCVRAVGLGLVCISHRNWENVILYKEINTHKTWHKRVSQKRKKESNGKKHKVEYKWATWCQSWCQFKTCTHSHHLKSHYWMYERRQLAP